MASKEQLQALQVVLRTQLLPKENTGLHYAIIKNLVKIDGALEKIEKQTAELNKQFSFKDEITGEPILYEYYNERDHPRFMQAKTDDNGNYITVKKEDQNKIACTNLINLLHPDYVKTIEQINNNIEITFHKFDSLKIKQLSEEGKLDKVDLTPLVGHLFDIIE